MYSKTKYGVRTFSIPIFPSFKYSNFEYVEKRCIILHSKLTVYIYYVFKM